MMKKILSLFAVLALTCSMYAAEVTVTETFDGAHNVDLNENPCYVTTPTMSFSPSTATGLKWTTYLGSVRNNQSNFSTIAAVLRARKASEVTDGCEHAYLLSSTITGGISDLSFKYNGVAKESGHKWDISVFVNDVEVGTIKNEDVKKYAAGSEKVFSVSNLAIEGNFTIKIVNNSDQNSEDNRYRFALDDVTWTGYAPALEEGSYWKETYDSMAVTSDYIKKATSIKGVKDVYSWLFYRYKYTGTDQLDNGNAVRLSQNSGNYIKMNGIQEGGIKSVRYCWSITGSTAGDVKFNVSITDGDTTVTRTATTYSAAAGVENMKSLVEIFNFEKNAQLNISISSAPGAILFSPITIVPYLLFTDKKPNVDISNSTSFDLKKILINNTGADPTYEILSNSTGSACTITEGVMDLSDIISEGDIQVRASWNEGKVYTTMTLHVTYNPTPQTGHYFEETFAAMTTSDKYGNQSVAGDSSVYGTWNFVESRRGSADAKEFRLNKKNAAAVSSADVLEGGIKDVYFSWRIAAGAENPVNLAFSMEAIGEDTVTAEMTNMPMDATETHPSVVHLNVEKNAQFKLEILTSKTNQVSLYSPLKFVPYLLYTKKNITINAKDYPTKKYTHPNLINNTGVEIEAGQKAIVFSIKDESDATKKIATVNEETGEVTLVGPGTVTVQATWGEVSTTYALTIKSTTLVTLLYDDGTEGKDEFTMNSGDIFPTDLAYPTRTDYTFNAYFTQKNGKGKRLTVTGDNQITQWTKNTVMTDGSRKWISLNQKDTLYAQWKAVRTITLNNQSATTAGTEQVKIAYCPNNEDIYLTDITIPERTGYIFNGYYTQTKGNGVQLITSDGKWNGKKNDEYVDEKYMWVKDADIILYASWTAKNTTVTMMRNDGTEDSDELTATYGQAFPTKTFTLPTRTGYEFNAYYTSLDCKAEERMTVTSGKDGRTLWLENRTVGDVTYTNGRNWIFLGETLTLYAQWAEQRTITLDNQGATTAGTVSVITANTPNNGLPWLGKKDITCPVKDDATFQGYFTEKNGEGEKLIGTDGKFIASVSGYTNSDKCWIKDADVTLYAYWQGTTVEITLNENNAKNDSIIAANAGNEVNVKTDRKITAGMFNTICLPFDVDAEQMATVFGEDYQLVEFASATLNEGKNELNLRFNTVDNLQAGVPYMIKTSAKKENISFSNVTIENTTGSSVGDDIKMYGIMSPTHLGAKEKTHLIVVANDKLSWVTNNDAESLRGMRAYLKVENEQVQAAIRRCNPRLVLNGTDTTTDIMQNAECTMQGVRKLLINGQLFIEHNDRLYNVLGY